MFGQVSPCDFLHPVPAFARLLQILLAVDLAGSSHLAQVRGNAAQQHGEVPTGEVLTGDDMASVLQAVCRNVLSLGWPALRALSYCNPGQGENQPRSQNRLL